MKSKTTDLPLTATPEGDIPAAPDLAAPKPVRRRRTAKAPAADAVSEVGAVVVSAEPDGAAPEAAVAPVGDPVAEVTAEPAAPPKRRRRKAAPAEAVEAAEPAAIELPPAPEKNEVFREIPAPESIVAAPAVAEPIAAAYPPEAELRPELPAQRADLADLADRAPEVSVGNSDTMAAETAAVEAPAGDTEAAEPGEPATGDRSSRRRGRRDRKRGQRADQPADGAPATERAPLAAPNEAASTPSPAAEADAEGDGDEPAAARPPRAEPTDVNEVFAKVFVGTFDAECEPAEEEAPYKRVLAPEPDAPKLHKVLAQAGVGSRRDMEQLILEGRITVNGEPAHIGQRISYGDQIKVSGKPVKVRIAPPPARVIAYHKPVGEVVTYHDPENRPTVFRRLPRLPQGKWQSVGRLDINTEGLLLFTNSGDLANQLTHPRFGVEREYAVRVLGSLDEYHREELLDGVDIDGQEASFRSIEDGGGEGANRWYRVVITEGRNREVRRMFEAVGLTVSRLIRIRYGNVVLPRGLKRGVWVDLDESDVRAIRRLAGGDDFRPQQSGKPGAGRNNGNGKNGRDRPRNNGNNNQNQANRGPRDDRNSDFDADHGPIPNPLEQTFDKRFVQKPRPLGGFGGPFGGGGFGPGGSNARGDAPRKGGPKQPDPMQTSVGYIGADAFHRKGNRGGNRGGGGGGGFGGGFGGGGGGRRGR